MAGKQTKKKTSKKSPGKKKNKGGRPSKLPGIDYKQVELLAGFGLIDKQIAQVLNICEKTLNTYKKDKRFLQSIKRGKIKADLEVVKSLFKRATGYFYDEVTKEPMFVVKKVKGEQKKIVLKKELVVSKIVTKHVIPDVIADIYWTKNRMKKSQGYEDDWKDRQEVKHSGEVSDGRLEVLDGLRAINEKERKKVLSAISEALNKKK